MASKFRDSYKGVKIERINTKGVYHNCTEVKYRITLYLSNGKDVPIYFKTQIDVVNYIDAHIDFMKGGKI